VPESAPAESGGGEIKALRNRDPDAWRQLFEHEMRPIYRYAFGRLGDVGRAEDATAEVFENAWQHVESFTDRGLPPRAWLFGIARNVVGTHWRRWFRQPPQLSLGAFDAPSKDGVVDYDNLDLSRAISQLEPSHAEVINLRFLHDLSLQEAAAALNVTVDAVKGRQARALSALRDRLAPAAIPPVNARGG
jgi:RNA polymerase sigma-70 factor (ECF subfamily)